MRAFFAEVAEIVFEVMRAERLARLVLAGTYSPDEHDAPLAELDWRGATPREAAALPALIVLETAERVRAGGMEAFSRILSGDRPIHVIVEETGDALAAAGIPATARVQEIPPVLLVGLWRPLAGAEAGGGGGSGYGGPPPAAP